MIVQRCKNSVVLSNVSFSIPGANGQSCFGVERRMADAPGIGLRSCTQGGAPAEEKNATFAE